MMMVVEQLIVDAALAVHGGPSFTYQGHQIDLTPPWPRKTLRDAIRDETGIDYVEFPERASLLAAARAIGAEIESNTTWPKIIDELLKQFVRPKLIQPLFLYDYPVSLSPLAKRKADDPNHVERFQLFVGGIEAANSFTELNDPMDQLARFRSQQREREAGDEETMPIDADYINALMFGMPPTGGVGIGIDRLTMLLTDQETLRDVILFPTLRKLPPEADPVVQMLEGVDPEAEGWVPPIQSEDVSETDMSPKTPAS
jgi:lysyl-tRNA synthetase class 2